MAEPSVMSRLAVNNNPPLLKYVGKLPWLWLQCPWAGNEAIGHPPCGCAASAALAKCSEPAHTGALRLCATAWRTNHGEQSVQLLFLLFTGN